MARRKKCLSNEEMIRITKIADSGLGKPEDISRQKLNAMKGHLDICPHCSALASSLSRTSMETRVDGKKVISVLIID